MDFRSLTHEAPLEKPSGPRKWLQAQGLYGQRNLFWSWYEPRNFGDWIGPYLFERLAKKTPLFCSKRQQKKASCFFTVGSILRHIKFPDRVTVWGSGIISRNDIFCRPLKTLAVRGPKTREHMIRLGYTCPEIYGDPAVLLPLVYSPLNQDLKSGIGIIPHYFELDAYRDYNQNCTRVIDVREPVEKVVTNIASCELTYSSSLHGLIVSHAYGVPSIWMESTEPLIGDDVKFEDYYASWGKSPCRRPSLLHTARSRSDEGIATQPDHSSLRAKLIKSMPASWSI